MNQIIESKLGTTVYIDDAIIQSSKRLDRDRCAIATGLASVFGEIYKFIIVSGISITLANDMFPQNWLRIRLCDDIRKWVNDYDTQRKPVKPFKMALIKDKQLMDLYCFKMVKENESGKQLEMF